jgi:arylsulfatase
MMNSSWNIRLVLPVSLAFALVAPAAASAQQQQQKPNILVIMADDIGYWNISAYNRGMMGYHTPNIDRIANEGAIFTDYYGQQSCTAGRAAFITGQSPLRTGLLKVGLPAAKEGLSAKDPTIAELLSRRATPPDNSARTILATETNSCRRCTGSMNSLEISIT